MPRGAWNPMVSVCVLYKIYAVRNDDCQNYLNIYQTFLFVVITFLYYFYSFISPPPPPLPPHQELDLASQFLKILEMGVDTGVKWVKEKTSSYNTNETLYKSNTIFLLLPQKNYSTLLLLPRMTQAPNVWHFFSLNSKNLNTVEHNC